MTRRELGGESDEVLLERQALHAARIEFDHPSTGDRMELSAPLAADIQRVLDQLDRLDSTSSKRG